jgi:hypothetical protein
MLTANREEIVTTRNVSKDSWSRCETPSMLYDATRRPATSVQPQKISVNNTDTLNANIRLKQEIIDKLENKGLELSHESYVAVVQVGKYMFMAIMLPVYLCCYGIPRWFLVNALPQLFMMLKNQSVAIGKMITDLRKRVIDLMKGMIEQLIGDALKTTKDKTKEFKNFIMRHFERVYNPIKNFIKMMAVVRENVKIQTAKKSAKLYGRAEENVQLMNKWLVERSFVILNQIHKAAFNLLHSFDKSILTPFINFIAPPFLFFATVVSSVKAALNKMKTEVKRQLRKVTDSVVSTIKKVSTKVANAITRRIEKAMEPLQNWMMEKKEVLKVYWQVVQQTIANPLIQAGMAMQVGFNSFSKKTIAIAKKKFSASKSMLNFAKKLIPEGFKQKLKEQKQSLLGFGKAFGRFVKGASSGFMEIIFLAARQCRKIGNKILAFLIFLKRAYEWISKQLSALPVKLLKFGKFLLRGFVLFAGRIAFAFQVLVALLVIAFLDGLQELKKNKPRFGS